MILRGQRHDSLAMLHGERIGQYNSGIALFSRLRERKFQGIGLAYLDESDLHTARRGRSVDGFAAESKERAVGISDNGHG